MTEKRVRFFIAVAIEILLLILSFLILCKQNIPFYQKYIMPVTLITFLTQLVIFLVWGWVTIFSIMDTGKIIVKTVDK